MSSLKIIDKKPIEIRGIKYLQITYSNGEKTLKRKHPSGMWVELKFSTKDDSDVLQRIKESAANVLLEAI